MGRGTSTWQSLTSALMVVLIAGCAPTDSQSEASTSCLEYLGLNSEARGRLVRTLGAEYGWSGASNPLLGVNSVDAACGSFENPDAVTVGSLLQDWADDQSRQTPGSDDVVTTTTQPETASTDSATPGTTTDLELLPEAFSVEFSGADAFSTSCIQSRTRHIYVLMGSTMLYSCDNAVGTYRIDERRILWETTFDGDSLVEQAFLPWSGSAVVQVSSVTPASGLEPAKAEIANHFLERSTGDVKGSRTVFSAEQTSRISAQSDFYVADGQFRRNQSGVPGPSIVLMPTAEGIEAWHTDDFDGPIWSTDKRQVYGVAPTTAVIEGVVVDVETGETLWTMPAESYPREITNTDVPYILQDLVVVDEAGNRHLNTGIVAYDERTGATHSELLTLPQYMTREGVLRTGTGITLTDYDGDEVWQISESVVADYAVFNQTIDQHLVVVNTSNEVIRVSLADGTDLGRLPFLPSAMSMNWALREEVVIGSHWTLHFEPVG